MTDPAQTIDRVDSRFEIQGRDLAVRRLRQRGGVLADHPLLVFLHEGLGSIALWGDFPDQLTALTGLDGLVYDRLGHGDSDPLPSPGADPKYQEPEAWLYLPELLDRCGIRRPFFIGHSDGGTIALLYAARFPDRPAGIITEAAHVCVDDLTLQGIRDTVQAYETSNLKEKLVRYHGEKIDAIFWRWADTWLCESFAGWDITGHLASITCPVLAIQGDRDEYGRPLQAETIASRTGGYGESWIVPDCRHVPHHQARRRVVARCAAFINHHGLGLNPSGKEAWKNK